MSKKDKKRRKRIKKSLKMIIQLFIAIGTLLTGLGYIIQTLTNK